MTTTNTLRSRLLAVASNLWWTWQPDVASLFNGLDPELWKRTNHNPITFLRELDDETLAQRAHSLSAESRIQGTYRRLEAYLNDRQTWAHDHVAMLAPHPVAYFSAEFGIHESLPLYSGGLGILAGDHMKSASDLGIPLVGVGIFYAQGYFRQYLDGDYRQQEAFGPANPDDLAIELVRDISGEEMRIHVPSGHEMVQARIWRARVGRNQLILLDTDVEGNTPDFREVTHRLYWGDNRSRIRQELVLGVGGLRAIKALGIEPGVYHLNEGHSSFALLEAIRDEMGRNGVDFKEAKKRIGSRSLFTTHTPVPAGHDRFHPDLIEEHLGWLRAEIGLSRDEFIGLGLDPEPEHAGKFCMTVLALKLARRANAVSAIHGEVSRSMWTDLWPNREDHEVPIGHVTNGVHPPTWIANPMRFLIQRQLGEDWSARLAEHPDWRKMARVNDHEIWETHEVMRSRLVDFIRTRYTEQELRRGRDAGAVAERASQLLDPRALTLGFARRFATYKRADLFLTHRERLERLLRDESRPVQMVFAGKAHPRDEAGKDLIQRIAHLQDEEPFRGRLVFLEDYDMNVARHLVQGVDVWVNNPQRPEEACGTSGMKAVLNGALNLSVLDGWWAEAYDGRNGFAIDSPGPHGDSGIQLARDADALYQTLEKVVIPLFFDREDEDPPRGWVDRMKWAFGTLAWRFSADRMVRDYALEGYLPSALGTSCSFPRS